MSTTIVFEFESNKACIFIQLSPDNLLEQTEDLEVVLSSDDPYVILTPDIATISILDTNGIFFGYITNSAVMMDFDACFQQCSCHHRF